VLPPPYSTRHTYACRIEIEPFTIAVDEEVLTDLRGRIGRTRWPDHIPGSGWQYGADVDYLRSLLSSWAELDWRRQEKEINRLAHYRAEIDGLRIHFLHERGNGPAPLPLVLTHGFPSSFVEYLDLLPLLTDPAGHGGRSEDAFDVVIPSMPGYGFSDPLTEPFLETTIADMWARLMTDGLGYDWFGAHGSDVGSGVTIELGLRHPEQLVGVHFSAFYLYPPPQPWPEPVQKFMDWAARRSAEDGAYSRMQSTKPQTVACGLTDSPVGMAAWIVDLFRSFSASAGDIESATTRERILANLTVWWVNATIGAAMRGYYDFGHLSETHRREPAFRSRPDSRSSPTATAPMPSARHVSSPSTSSTSPAGPRCRAAATSQRSRRLSSWRMRSASSFARCAERGQSPSGIRAAGMERFRQPAHRMSGGSSRSSTLRPRVGDRRLSGNLAA
jgi:pimeloyl-ACP methyl ester carboxylesterase